MDDCLGAFTDELLSMVYAHCLDYQSVNQMARWYERTDLNMMLSEIATEMGLELAFFQSNSEGAIIVYIHEGGAEADGIIINPGALTHYSYALRDAISAIETDVVEVHISNLYGREDFRRKSVSAPVCVGQLVGFGLYGYAMALSYFSDRSERE